MAKSKKYFSKSRKAAIVLFIFTLFLFIIGLSENSVSETYSANNMAPGVTFLIITIVVFIYSLFAPKNKEEELRRKESYIKPSASSRFIGVILSVLGGFFSLGLLMPALMLTDEEFYNAAGIAGIIIGILMGLFGLFVFAIGRRYLRGVRINPDFMLQDDKNVGLYDDETTEDNSLSYKNGFSSIDFMNGHEFEYFCAGVLKENGFSNVRVTPGSGDQGVDVLATKDGIKYAIQCKNYASSLGNTPIQEVHAGKAFYNCHVGVVMTNSIFTTGAKELAKATGVLLWDRTTLQKMIEEAEPTIDIED